MNVTLPAGARCFLAGLMLFAASGGAAQVIDNFSDTWVATDALGRKLPTQEQVGPPRPDRAIGIFYFLWHGAHIKGGPYDVSEILRQDPDAMRKPGSPLWGPLHAPHHWGQPLFGYYLADDEGVLRKHAQMLGDAGVDVVIFDVTNQLTYPEWYRALLRVWSDVRRAGNRTPQVAFLTPFWEPRKVVHELWRDLYSKDLHRELWFQWEGKPLILADPQLVGRFEDHAKQDRPVELRPGHSLGQTFTATQSFISVGGRFPTWNTTGAAVTLTLRRSDGADGVIATKRFRNVSDNAWLMLSLPQPLGTGSYLLEASDATGRIGWWSHSADVQTNGHAVADGRPVSGDRTLRLEVADEDVLRLRQFFTFRKPQPDYFQGQTQADMWSWLEVHPQHVFTNALGQKEQMSVGVAQNAVNGRLGSMSEPGAHGRSFHHGARDRRDHAVLHGFNFTEQWERALKEDPRFIFVTGWNEWIAGRFAEFNRIKLPVMFVDQFDQEHSRDIEPMRGGHGDNYHWQMIDYIRRYKGVRPIPPVQPSPVSMDGAFDDWSGVEPEYRDTIGDPVNRSHRGWDVNVTYTNFSGRNDIVLAKMSFDSTNGYFYVRSREAITPPGSTNWMLLFIDVDGNAQTGWLGYEVVVNRTARGSLERHGGDGFAWQRVGDLECRVQGNELELAIPWRALGLQSTPAMVEFKWADNCIQSGDWRDFTLNGDAAPNDRFNYRALLKRE